MAARGSGSGIAFALAMALAALAGCGDGGGGGEMGVDPGDNSVVVIHLSFDPGTPPVYQIEVHAHLGNAGQDATRYFPIVPNTDPIQSADTLGLLISPTIMDMLDLTLYGLDHGTRVAVGMGRADIVSRKQVDTPVTLKACGNTGC